MHNQLHVMLYDWLLFIEGMCCLLKACADDLVSTVLDGCNATILAYGQTGAGKTYTMTGGKADYQQRGLIPRSIHKVSCSTCYNCCPAQRGLSAWSAVTVSPRVSNDSVYDISSAHLEDNLTSLGYRCSQA